jgi:glycosyltransferase involved in cell wall biosynthesis
MAVYDGGPYLGEAVESILAQTFTDFELLVVNDGSTDDSAAILARYADDPRLRILTNVQNAGLTRSLNKALAAATGELIARQDADDRSLPHRFRRQVEFMDANPAIALLGSDVRMIDHNGRPRRRRAGYRARTPLGARWQLLFGNPFIHSAVMFRRDVVVDRLGGYDETHPLSQDFELWSRLMADFNACNLGDVLLDHRTHARSIGGRRDAGIIASRSANMERNIAIQRRNVAAILADDALADEWPPLWTAINVEWLAGPPQNPLRALALMERMFCRFVELNPRAEQDADIAAHRSQVLWTLARYFATHDPRACAEVVFSYWKHRRRTRRYASGSH